MEPPQDSSPDSLSLAARNGDSDTLKTMLDASPNPEAMVKQADSQGYTPLHWAALHNHKETVKVLLEKGASPNQAPNSSTVQTPFHWAAINGHVEVMMMLVDNGANIHLVDHFGFNSLHYAAKNGHPLALHFLIGLGMDKDYVDFERHTSLHWAAYEGQGEAAMYLLTAKAQVNLFDVNHYTPLHWAAIKGRREIVTQLLRHGADPKAVDSNGNTAGDCAAEQGFHSLSHFLKGVEKRGIDSFFPREPSMFVKTALFCLPTLLFGLVIWVFMNFEWIAAILAGGFMWLSLSMLQGMLCMSDGYNSIFPAGYGFAGMVHMQLSYYGCLYDSTPTELYAIFLVFTICKFYCFYVTVSGNPGYLTGPRVDAQTFRRHIENGLTQEKFCVTCMIPKPPRSKHCKVCGKCVARFDHHCPWVANCVASKNHPTFVAWLFFLTSCNAICLALCIYFWNVNENVSWWSGSASIFSGFADAYKYETYPLVATFCNILHFPWFFMLFASQCYFVCRGITTNETINWHRYAYLRVSDGKGGRKSLYDLGFIRNWLQFCGLSERVDWTVPYPSPTLQVPLPMSSNKEV